jgi:hypothetical protein
MPKWEYQHSAVPVDIASDDRLGAAWAAWVEHCNELGQDGWELISYEFGKANPEAGEYTRPYVHGMFKRAAGPDRKPRPSDQLRGN